MVEFPDNRLILYPSEMNARLDLSVLLPVLQNIGLLVEELPAASVNGLQGQYLVGERFFEHVSFLGCSPQLQLTPPAKGDDMTAEFCHVGIDCSNEIRFLGGDNVRAPQCTQCKSIDKDWQSILPEWQKAPEMFSWQCPHCGATKPLHLFNWRRTAGFAAVSVHIWGVHQSEAVPNEGLLNALKALTHCPWQYFYRNSLNH